MQNSRKKQGKEQEERSAGSISRLSSCLKQINLPAKRPLWLRMWIVHFTSDHAMLLRQFFIRTKMYLNLKEIILKGLKRGNKQMTLTIEQVACYVTVYRDNRRSTCIFFPVTETTKETKIIKSSVFKLKKKKHDQGGTRSAAHRFLSQRVRKR